VCGVDIGKKRKDGEGTLGIFFRARKQTLFKSKKAVLKKTGQQSTNKVVITEFVIVTKRKERKHNRYNRFDNVVENQAKINQDTYYEKTCYRYNEEA
jgi:hypothetical protein